MDWILQVAGHLKGSSSHRAGSTVLVGNLSAHSQNCYGEQKWVFFQICLEILELLVSGGPKSLRLMLALTKLSVPKVSYSIHTDI